MPPVDPEIRELRRQVAELRARVDQLTDRHARGQDPRQPRLAIVLDPGTRPANVYPIKFADATFPLAAGLQTLTVTSRQASRKAFAYNLLCECLAEGDLVEVFWDSERWWIGAACAGTCSSSSASSSSSQSSQSSSSQSSSSQSSSSQSSQSSQSSSASSESSQSQSVSSSSASGSFACPEGTIEVEVVTPSTTFENCEYVQCTRTICLPAAQVSAESCPGSGSA